MKLWDHIGKNLKIGIFYSRNNKSFPIFIVYYKYIYLYTYNLVSCKVKVIITTCGKGLTQ